MLIIGLIIIFIVILGIIYAGMTSQ